MRALAWLLWLATVPASAGVVQARIELLPAASVPGGEVLLGDVARLRSSDLAVMRTLVHLPVGRAPRHGEAALLRRADLAQWIRRHTGLAPDALEWSGAQEMRVLRAKPLLRGEDIARAAMDAARSSMSGTGYAGELSVRTLPRDLAVPEGRVRMEVRGLDRGSWPRRMLAWVDVWAGAVFVRAVPVSLHLGGVHAPMLQEAAASDGSVSTEPSAQQAMTRDGEPVAVTRGEWAVLRSTEGSISLEHRVEVLQDGRPGQRIRVRPQGGGGTLFARVLAPGQLELAP